MRHGAEVLGRARDAFPRGGLLPDDNWRRRHLALCVVLLGHVPVILSYALLQGYDVRHSLLDAGFPLILAGVGLSGRFGRAARSMAVASGLISCSVILVHLSNGLTETHFHFFVMVALLSLYQDWKPFLIAIGITVFEHGVTGIVAPHSVYNHADAWAHPWKWAFIHGGYVVAASVASLAAWSMSEADHYRIKAATARRIRSHRLGVSRMCWT